VIETKTVASSDVPPRQQSSNAEDGSVGGLIESVKAYAQQETLGPLKGAGQWIGYGAAAAVTLGFGLFLILLGLLRLLQTEWERSASGALSWLAYLITLVVTVVLLALTVQRIKKSTLHKEPK
jgi:hypothetical protein